MSQYYNPHRIRDLYKSGQKEAYPLSRSKIDLFLNCPRCFYLDRKLGVGQPPGYPFTLNSAVDTLLKKEFDLHRAQGQAHPLMDHYGIKAVPFSHPEMDNWRNTFHGVRCLHSPTNFLVFGAVDDIWENKNKELHIVDYKATAKESEISLDADWQIGYKRQMEIYQWLLRSNKFNVSDIGYFVYCNGRKDREAFDGKLEFDVIILPYQGNDSWMEAVLLDAKKCLEQETLPASGNDCDFCKYREAAAIKFGG